MEHDEVRAEPGDGRRMATASLALAIAGIIVPIVLSIAAFFVASRAKTTMGIGDEFRHHRSLASSAQVLAVIDLFAQLMFVTIFFVVFD